MIRKFYNLRNILRDLPKARNYILIYILFLIFFIFSFFNGEDYLRPTTEIIAIFLLLISGILIILYSLKNKADIHKIAFLIILVFGLLTVFFSPPLTGPDELEHFARSDLTSSGILFPEYTVDRGFYMPYYVFIFYHDDIKTFLNWDYYDTSVGDAYEYFPSVFLQNPFYGYIAQGIGIFIAKLLDLNIIFVMWFGRIFNLLFYGVVSSIAIKKAPIFKIQLLVISCMPLGIFQAASVSIDSFIFSVGFLIIAYFIYMYKSKEKVKKRDLFIFFISCLLIGMIKFPLILLVLLIFLIPKDRFESKNSYIYSRIFSILIIFIAISYTGLYSMNQVIKSERAIYYAQNNVSVMGQVNYILDKPGEAIIPFLQIANTIPEIFISKLNFFHIEFPEGSVLLNFLFFIYFSIFSILYPNDLDLSRNNKIKILFIIVFVYIGTFLIQYLSWTPVGYSKVLGVSARYFLPIIPLIPMLIGIKNISLKNDNLNMIIINLTIIFLSGMILLTVSWFY